jgi:hypothetical protein
MLRRLLDHLLRRRVHLRFVAVCQTLSLSLSLSLYKFHFVVLDVWMFAYVIMLTNLLCLEAYYA